MKLLYVLEMMGCVWDGDKLGLVNKLGDKE